MPILVTMASTSLGRRIRARVFGLLRPLSGGHDREHEASRARRGEASPDIDSTQTRRIPARYETMMFLRLVGWVAGPAGLAAAVAGCVTNSAGSFRDGDPELFAAEVQPIIRRECAFEGCHGREGMPLTLYAVDFLRLRDPEGDVDTGRTPLDELALSEAELDHNRRAIATRVSTTDPEGQGLLQRLLSPDEGGVAHGGVVVYARSDHPDIEILRRFLRSVDVD